VTGGDEKKSKDLWFSVIIPKKVLFMPIIHAINGLLILARITLNPFIGDNT